MPDKTPRADDDSGWKEAIEVFLNGCFRLCFPSVAALIDWSVEPVFLEQELRHMVRGDARGKNVVDVLVSLRKMDGTDACFHIEVCGYYQFRLPQRLFLYHNRLDDRHSHQVYTLLILADNRPRWRPDCYEDTNGFNTRRFSFPLCKLLDFLERWDELEQSDNPFAHLVIAHLRALETRGNMPLRMERAWELTLRLYKKGLSEKTFWDLHRLSDWLLPLPEDLALQLRGRILEYEQEKGVMPYVTSFERMARDQGWEQGRKEGLEKGMQRGLERGQIQTLRQAVLEVLSLRFGEIPLELHHALEAVSDKSFLRHLHQQAVLAESLAAFKGHLDAGQT